MSVPTVRYLYKDKDKDSKTIKTERQRKKTERQRKRDKEKRQRNKGKRQRDKESQGMVYMSGSVVVVYKY